MREDTNVDPRDGTWEQDRPVYRVSFCHQPSAPPGVAQHEVGYHCDEYRRVGATDVHEVLAWAEARRKGEDSYTVYVETDANRPGADGIGLIRLAGIDLTVPTEPPNESATAAVWIPGAP